MTPVELSLESLDLQYAGLRARRPEQEKRLMASMGDGGQQSPVVVVPGEAGRYIVIDGHKRVRALEKLKADCVRAVVWAMKGPEALVTMYQMISGTGWTAVEEGWLVWELVRKAGFSVTETGRRLERSAGWVSGRLGLVEGLPEAVLEGVRTGKMGAYVATRYLMPFARANGADGERLAEKVLENGYRSREVETLCRYYETAGKEGRRKMLEDPTRFLKALESTAPVGDLGREEARCFKDLELIGHISMGLSGRLVGAMGRETSTAARDQFRPAWELARGRWEALSKTVAAVLSGRGVP